MAKADLRKAETAEWDLQIGKVIEGLMLSQGWSLKEFADALNRNERQVARWINGMENPQLGTIFAVTCLQKPLVFALAKLANGVEVIQEIRFRGIA